MPLSDPSTSSVSKGIPNPSRRSAAGPEPLHVLYLTDDIVEADCVAFQLRKSAPHIRMDVQPGSALHKLESGRHDAALIDCRHSGAIRAKLAEQLRDGGREFAVVLILRVEDDDSTARMLKAGADAHILRHRNFRNEIPDALSDAIRQRRSRLRTALDDSPRAAAMQRLVLNKRRSRRLKVRIEGVFECDGASRPVVVHDLSESGAFLETCVPPPVGTDLVLRVETGRHTLSLRATVMHLGWFMNDVRNFSGFGVRFGELDEESAAGLRQLLSVEREPSRPKTVLTC